MINVRLHTFSLRSTFFGRSIPVKTYIKLFDTIVKPILLYGAEVWGPYLYQVRNSESVLHKMLSNVSTLMERLHSKVCKQILLVNRKASNYAVRCELGRYPLCINVICAVFKYYVNVQERQEHSLVHLACKMRKTLGSLLLNM